MQSARSAITALGIALALVAMPASAGWYYQNSAPSGDTATPGVLEDDPIDLLEELKQVDNDLSPRPTWATKLRRSSLQSCSVCSRTR